MSGLGVPQATCEDTRVCLSLVAAMASLGPYYHHLKVARPPDEQRQNGSLLLLLASNLHPDWMAAIHFPPDNAHFAAAVLSSEAVVVWQAPRQPGAPLPSAPTLLPHCVAQQALCAPSNRPTAPSKQQHCCCIEHATRHTISVFFTPQTLL